MGAANKLTKVDRFRLLENVASGGMGDIFFALDPKAGNQPVAIKVARIGDIPKARREQASRFLNEMKIATLLDHPHIVRVYDVGIDSGNLFLVMEWLQGWNLQAILRQLSLARQLLPVPLVLKLLLDAARGLRAAHETRNSDGQLLNLVHRDIKPANLFVTTEGVVKIIDFGVARTALGTRQTKDGIVLGTCRYMSPEQIQGHVVDQRSDVFSLGVVGHELLTGTPLFRGESIDEVCRAIEHEFIPPPQRADRTVGDGVLSLIMRALERRPELRTQDAAVLCSELEAQLDRGPPPRANAELTQLLLELMSRVPSSDRPTRRLTLDEEELAVWAGTTVVAFRTRDGSCPPEATAPVESRSTSGHERPGPSRIGTWTRRLTRRLETTPRWRWALWVAVALGSGIAASHFRDFGRTVTVLEDIPAASGTTGVEDKGVVDSHPVPTTDTATRRPSPGSPGPSPSKKVTQRRTGTRGGRGKKRSAVPAIAPLPSTAADQSTSPAPPPPTAPGFLTLETDPWAEVYHGSQLLGTTPLVRTALPVGRIRLRLVNPTEGRQTIWVKIESGQTLKKRMRWGR